MHCCSGDVLFDEALALLLDALHQPQHCRGKNAPGEQHSARVMILSILYTSRKCDHMIETTLVART
jgi:hypothetical protein